MPEETEGEAEEKPNGKPKQPPMALSLNVVDGRPRPRKFRVMRDATGKIEGAEAVEERASEPPPELPA